MPVLTAKELKSFRIPAKRDDRIRIAISYEFTELYRGDKDLRKGKLLSRDYGYEVVQLGTDIASPSDSHFFGTKKYPAQKVGQLPEHFYLLLMKSMLIYHRKGNVGMGGFFRLTPGLIRELKRWQPDLILENPYLTLSPRSYMTHMVSKRLNIPMVYMDCGDIMPELSFKHKLMLPMEKRVVNNAAAVITYNKEGKKRFISKYEYPSEKIYVIPKPMNTSKFSPDKDCSEFRSKFNLENSFTVAYFGRLCLNKGAKHLLYAADILRKRGIDKDIKILFVGGNVESEQSSDFMDHFTRLNLKNVILTGMIPNEKMPEAYASVDMAVYPDVTNLPGFSTVLAESMASGLPVIIGIKGWEDAIPITDGENGIIIEHANPEQIANKIELLKGNHQLRNELSQNVLRFAREKMDYDRVIEKYNAIFENIIKKRGRKITRNYAKHIEHKAEKAAV